MTALRIGGAGPAGCVLRIDTGVAVVLTDDGVRRAGYGARMLGDVARDRGCAPQAGDWVRLRRWPDGRTTLEECLTRAAPPRVSDRVSDRASEGASATVLEFRAPVR